MYVSGLLTSGRSACNRHFVVVGEGHNRSGAVSTSFGLCLAVVFTNRRPGLGVGCIVGGVVGLCSRLVSFDAKDSVDIIDSFRLDSFTIFYLTNLKP
jgi:hypothetical protein